MSKKPATPPPRNPAETRRRLVEATVGLILKQGYSATSVDQICSAASLTKGSFFHHFDSKEAIGLAAADWWGEMGTALYAAAWADPALDPLDQLHRFFDIMIGSTERVDTGPCTCVVGMLSQEMSGTSPDLRAACTRHLEDWTRNTAAMLRAAKEKYPVTRDFDPEETAWFLNCLWQGSMLIGKTRNTPEMIRANLRQARAWVDGLFITTAS
ncbi:MAG: Transcriptional regulator, TetR family [Verrucomicrobiales bacterium]|nr:Transcriptional regulator, TetR family [Verrucomicrobiales bacterium]